MQEDKMRATLPSMSSAPHNNLPALLGNPIILEQSADANPPCHFHWPSGRVPSANILTSCVNGLIFNTPFAL